MPDRASPAATAAVPLTARPGHGRGGWRLASRSTLGRCRRGGSALLLSLAAGVPAAAQSPGYDFAFERDLFKTRFEHEVKFREAVIHVAWAAEALCASRTEIEPFVLWSTHTLRRRLSDRDMKMFREATGMDDKWRLVWVDESVPDELKLGAVVIAINGRKLPDGATRVALSALFTGGSVFSSDDQGFWDVMHAARDEAAKGRPMTLTVDGGREVKVETQTGCAGSVTASAFDADPDVFSRLGNQRVKIPANAMIEARSRDEFRWLAAFGTYFQASQSALAAVHKADGMSTGFTVGKIFALALPGAGMLLAAAEAQSERRLLVDSIVGGADLFAGEVVAALGGDPAAGLKLTERMRSRQMKVDVVLMDELRRSNAAEHARRIGVLQAAQEAAEQKELEREREVAQKAAQNAAQNAAGAETKK